MPQSRHRVIIVGLRRDVAALIGASSQTAGGTPNHRATVRDVLFGLPSLRSGLSISDLDKKWRSVVIDQMDRCLGGCLDRRDPRCDAGCIACPLWLRADMPGRSCECTGARSHRASSNHNPRLIETAAAARCDPLPYELSKRVRARRARVRFRLQRDPGARQ